MSRYLAIDLDPQGLFVVSGSARGGAAVEHALAWVGGDEHPPPPLTADTARQIGEGLRERLKAAGIAPAPVLVAVGRDKVILKEVKFPPVPPAEEPALVRFQALKELTESPDDVVLDYVPLDADDEDGPGGDRRATVVAVRKEVMAAVRAMCGAAGLKLAGVTPRPFAVAAGLARAAAGGAAPEPGAAAVAVLTLGTQGGEFTVVRGRRVAFTRSVPAPVLANDALLVGEVRRNLTVYAGTSPVRAVYVAEADDLLGGWAGRLRAGLSLPVHSYDPVAGAAEAVPDRLRGRFAGAAGLLAGKAADALPVNFASPRQPRAEADPRRKQYVWAAVAAGLLLLAGGAFGFLELAAADDQLERLRAEKAELEKQSTDDEGNRKRLEAVEAWEKRGVNYLDELFDMADRFPAGDRLRASEFKMTALPVDKNGKQDAQARLELTVAVKPEDDAVIPLRTALDKDAVAPGGKTRYYSGSQRTAGGTPSGATAFNQSYIVRISVYHREPKEFTRAPAFSPPPRPRPPGPSGADAPPAPTRRGPPRENHPMNARERTLAVLLSGLIVVGVAAGAGYFLVYEPVQAKQREAGQLAAEIGKLRDDQTKLKQAQARLAVAKRRSLPPDAAVSASEYNEMLLRLARRAGLTAYKVTPGTPDNRGVPLLPGAAKKPVYTKVVSVVDFSRADMWEVKDFLEGYYRLGLLHQITNIQITRKDGGGAADRPRHDLTVRLTSEALVLDGAENRTTLLPVPSAFAAVGGLAGYAGLTLSKEAGRGLAPVPLAPVLAAKGRDYSFLAVKDMFHGPLPPPRPLSADKIPEVVVKLGDPVGPVKVPLGGDFAYLGRISLTAAGPADAKLLPPDAIAVDPVERTVTVTPTEGETGSEEVTVVARSETGQEVKTSFKLTVQPPKAPPPKEDVSAFIVLVGVSTSSDGTASAVVRDNANNLKYEVEATPRGVVVTKFWFPGKDKREVKDRAKLPAELVIADDTSGTSRRFKVVAVDPTGLVVEDVAPAAAEKAPPPKAAKRPGNGERPAAGSDAPVEPKAADPASPPLLRWTVGKSLVGLTPVPPDEARRILGRAAERGPVGATAAAPPAGAGGN